jgi:serine/threonine protein kinase
MNIGDPNLNSQESDAETSRHWSNTGSANCLAIGTRLAEFEITGVVGEGGFGNVYLAFDHSLQRTVAIKEYMPVALASRGADDRVLVQSKRHKETFATGMNSFINEARLLAQFDHPALIKVYRFWEQNNTAYMAMRYYEGHTFKSIVSSNPDIVSEAWLKPILKPILEALEVLYKIQILHRDISPENIMIQANGDAVLLDFGAARQIIGDLTQALTVILKPGYAPVEQYAEDSEMRQGPWTDIYALSAVVYSAIVHKPPPTSVTRLIKDPIDLLQNTTRQGFSKAFLAAIDKGMAVKPDDRPQSIGEFSKMLGIDMSATTHASPQPVSKPPIDAAKRNGAKKADKAKSSSTRKPESVATDKKASMIGSWTMVVAGVVLAATAGTSLYRGWHNKSQPTDTVTAPVSFAAPVASAASSIAPPGPSSASVASGEASSITAFAPGVPHADMAVTTPAKSTGQAARAVKGATVALASNSAPATRATAESTPAASANTVAPTQEGAPVDDAAKSLALVRLTIKPWANVLVDGSPKGVSPPLKRLMLPDGKHQIRFVNPNFPDHVVDITINSKRRFGNVEYDFSSQ